jgi:hypothetical protein
MEKKEYISQIDYLSAEQIVEGISDGIVTFDELKKTGEFGADKQKKVKALLTKKEDESYDAACAAHTKEAFEHYLSVFPAGKYADAARNKIQQFRDELIFKEDNDAYAAACATNTKEAFENYLSKFFAGKYADEARVKIQQVIDFEDIVRNVNEYTPEEIKNKLSYEKLNDLCWELGIDAQLVMNYREPELKFNPIPQNERDIPVGYTDVFFWGIPSSGKTCALSAIFHTIQQQYTLEAADCNVKFGATYRDTLINIFRHEYGNLPPRTNTDRTQYMPFLLSKRGEKKKRRISFFELSGELFKYFYEVVNNADMNINENDREDIEKSFRSLDLLLNSNNQKIHFFFIDYNQETRHTSDRNGYTQNNYLQAAATYFRDKNDIFRKKTDAVFVVVTKSDEIQGTERERAEKAKKFLNDNFGGFMDVLKIYCTKRSIDFRVKLFSIGDVYFKRICRINRAYSADIINDLLVRVKPVNENKILDFFGK